MTRSIEAQEHAEAAADFLEKEAVFPPPTVGIVLGTGWGDLLKLNNEQRVPLSKMAPFKGLAELPGHSRVVCFGEVSGHQVVALRGRVHMNEKLYDKDLGKAVRLQIEMLIALGARTFILTNAAGGLGDKASVGDIVICDGFVTLYAPDMPLEAGEFCSPEDVLDKELQCIAMSAGPESLPRKNGGFAMVRGPYFEGRKYDKALLRQSGASCVGMSLLPEASIISLYRKEGARAVAVSYITNDDCEEHSHEANMARAKQDAPLLSELLENIIRQI